MKTKITTMFSIAILMASTNTFAVDNMNGPVDKFPPKQVSKQKNFYCYANNLDSDTEISIAIEEYPFKEKVWSEIIISNPVQMTQQKFSAKTIVKKSLLSEEIIFTLFDETVVGLAGSLTIKASLIQSKLTDDHYCPLASCDHLSKPPSAHFPSTKYYGNLNLYGEVSSYTCK